MIRRGIPGRDGCQGKDPAAGTGHTSPWGALGLFQSGYNRCWALQAPRIVLRASWRQKKEEEGARMPDTFRFLGLEAVGLESPQSLCLGCVFGGWGRVANRELGGLGLPNREKGK